MKKSKTGGRIVSKSEYIANIGRKALASSVGAGLLVMSMICMLIVGFSIWLILTRTPHGGLDAHLVLSMIFVFGILISAVVYIYRLGKREIMTSIQMDAGVPLTRSNTASLPAPDFLVRASEKPSEEQASTLLRAAADTPMTPADQLLRPATYNILEPNMPETNALKAGSQNIANG